MNIRGHFRNLENFDMQAVGAKDQGKDQTTNLLTGPEPRPNQSNKY